MRKSMWLLSAGLVALSMPAYAQETDTDADRHRRHTLQRALLNGPAYALGNLHRDMPGRTGHENHKLFPTVTRAQVEDSNPATQQAGDVAQRTVPFEVPKRIVDALEVVYVDHQQREILLLATCALYFGLDLRLEVTAVEEASHRVHRGGFRQLAEALGNSFSRQGQGCWRCEQPR